MYSGCKSCTVTVNPSFLPVRIGCSCDSLLQLRLGSSGDSFLHARLGITWMLKWLNFNWAQFRKFSSQWREKKDKAMRNPQWLPLEIKSSASIQQTEKLLNQRFFSCHCQDNSLNCFHFSWVTINFYPITSLMFSESASFTVTLHASVLWLRLKWFCAQVISCQLETVESVFLAMYVNGNFQEDNLESEVKVNNYWSGNFTD
jgi:hypothetical protein